MWCSTFIYLMVLKTILCANILIMNDMASPSHQLWNFAYAKGLIEKGHNVTMVTVHLTKNVNYTNFHQIYLEGVYDKLYSEMDIQADKMPTTVFGKMKLFFDFTYRSCELTHETNGFKEILSYPSDKFDLIVFDITLANGCLYPFIQHFNYPPTMGITAFLLPPHVSHFYGNHLHPSYLPFFHLDFDTEMTFLERVQNTFFTYVDTALKVFWDIPPVEKIHKQVFGEKVDSVENLQRHISLVLANISPIFNIPQPVTPNIIPVGGLHTRPGKKLSTDIQAILDSSKYGVVLFSLGTNIRSDELGEYLINQIINAFSKLPYTFLWKFESDLKTPKNIIIRKWLPINDILAHKNVKLFISHGGGLSTQEAMYHGVPVLGVPILADQHLNVAVMTKRKIATKIALEDITTDSLSNLIQATISNPIYTKNMKQISQRFKDFPQTPLEKAVHWSEYVIKHGGAQFLNTPARDLPFFVSYGFDVLAFFIFTLLSILVVVKALICSVKNLCFSKVSSKTKKD